MRSAAGGSVAFVLLATTIAAQLATVTPTAGLEGGPAQLSSVLDKLSAYLVAYEPELSALIAEESFAQRTLRGLRTMERRVLVSDVAFMRLPGNRAWLGFREVRRVDAREITRSGPTLMETLARPGRDNDRLAVEMAWESAQYNLGEPRTINMPLLPLELMHPRNRSRFGFTLGSGRRVAGFATVEVSFVEQSSPSLVRPPDNRGDMLSSGTLWIEPETGRLIKAEVRISEGTLPSRGSTPREGVLVVEFAEHPELKLLVPSAMTEQFLVTAGSGEGRASYSKFRRFSTSARIVPQ